ncbi:hypothetical protein CcI49_32390 [Frankia sp. CcI49]|uniref:DUF948 domain-containing protein n=1 Tax=Parafrankia irregularis TaxID=795642 RepID=A0A0S4QPF7_9ACTN|nr:MULTISPECIES: DUF948 domain-containing protein [Frankiaceae]MBE3206249.1 DUF948 domain-containing protein [Parafrankia sp. CH37]ONH53462.1 hypothetical protein CcI49_32390 [Frankia sp. CcI49]CUU57527.1 protein of unknown function (DUF948) [Parafrankia irregularis]
MSGGAVAGLIASGAFAVLVLFACYVLFKLGKIFDEAAARVRQTGVVIDEGTARVRQAGATVDEVNVALAHVNKELERIDAITANVQTVTTNVSSLTSIFAATLGGPVVRVAAFSYGVRQAVAKRTKADVTARVSAQMKAEKAQRRSARRSPEATAVGADGRGGGR